MTTELTSPHHIGATAALDILGLLKYAGIVDVDPVLNAFKEFKHRGWEDAEHVVGDAVKDKALNWWEKISPRVRAGLLVGAPVGLGTGAGLSQVKDSKTHKKWGVKGWLGGAAAGTAAGLGAAHLRGRIPKFMEERYDRMREGVEANFIGSDRTPLEDENGHTGGLHEVIDAVKARVPSAPWNAEELKNQSLGDYYQGRSNKPEAARTVHQLSRQYVRGLEGQDLAPDYPKRGNSLISLLRERIPAADDARLSDALASSAGEAAMRESGIDPEVVQEAQESFKGVLQGSLYSGRPPSIPDMDAAYTVGRERRQQNFDLLRKYKKELNKSFTTSDRLEAIHEELYGY